MDVGRHALGAQEFAGFQPHRNGEIQPLPQRGSGAAAPESNTLGTRREQHQHGTEDGRDP
jgi:hypothetical protein